MDARYQELLDKIEAKSAEISAAHAASLNCQRGCHGCCQAGLTVFPVEAAAIHEYLEQGHAEKALQNEAERPHGESRCSFLDRQGACLIYPVRPVICRTHGLPLRVKTEAGANKRDCCPLNFKDQSLDELADSSVLNLDLINTLLVLINSHFLDGKDTGRVSLKASEILGST